jgi:hypothetical protein
MSIIQAIPVQYAIGKFALASAYTNAYNCKIWIRMAFVIHVPVRPLTPLPVGAGDRSCFYPANRLTDNWPSTIRAV